MKVIQVTLQERWMASQSRVHKSKKQYSRKDKHRKGPQKGPFSLSIVFPIKQGRESSRYRSVHSSGTISTPGP